MNRYSYTCLDKEGQKLQGVIDAENDESARIKLMEQGLKILIIGERYRYQGLRALGN